MRRSKSAHSGHPQPRHLHSRGSRYPPLQGLGMRPTIVDNDHQINLWLLSWAFFGRSPSRVWAVSESSPFDFGSILVPFLWTNHTRIGQSTLVVHIHASPSLDIVYVTYVVYLTIPKCFRSIEYKPTKWGRREHTAPAGLLPENGWFVWVVKVARSLEANLTGAKIFIAHYFAASQAFHEFFDAMCPQLSVDVHPHPTMGA